MSGALCRIIIINYGSTWDLEKNIRSLEGGGLSDLEVVVVHNPSADLPSLSWVKEYSSCLRYIENTHNIGFARAANKGAANAATEWLLFLNPDVLILPTQIRAMIEEANKHEWSAACPKTKDKRYSKPIPTLMTLFAEFTPLGGLSLVNKYLQRLPRTMWGGCFLIKTAIFRALGGFDERFFLWFEDSDLSRRLIENGYTIGAAEVPVKHIGGASFVKMSEKEKRKVFFSSMLLYAKIHFPWWQQLFVRLIASRYVR
jgi:GT2 family glycosyltransferase